ncbi:MAG TPA: outer membrane beta-barrel protein [Candidatus Acidoferrales bacterium]|nr:outer membrane beta-barrel protein [Candidatus Acidoferrales bacterium]
MTKIHRRLIAAVAACLLGLLAWQSPSYSQSNQTPSNSQPPVVHDDKTPPVPPAGATTKDDNTSKTAAKPSNAEILAELEQMRARIQELEARLKEQSGDAPTPGPAGSSASAADVAPISQPPASGVVPVTSGAISTSKSLVVQADPTKPARTEPFAFADFTWLNGSSRTSESPLDTKFFTPEFRADVSYIEDFNHPSDHTLVGSSESGRTGEVQLQQLGVGGDFHVGNVRGRLMTQFGMYSTMTPRNDGSTGVGQWNLADAYRYISEAYGGYHFNVLHGVNVDAGIFMSYIGLFSYYNFDNWAYQPSYVSSNTPWFFEGVRVQIFPTDKLKFEPWFINGWQSYGKFNHYPGAGGQIEWRPNGWLRLIFNNYGLGTDTLGIPARSRIHADYSVEVKYYDQKDNFLDKMAFTLTGDAGCEYGGGVSCFGTRKGGGCIPVAGNTNCPKQSFLGFMAYHRFWFERDKFGLTIGGGMINNPGRYLVLVPPINGATAITGTPYFTGNPGDKFKAWDASATFDYMPAQFITFRWEYDYRHANVPYFAGSGGVTPVGGNTGTPGVPVPGFTPDLRKDESRINLALLVKF